MATLKFNYSGTNYELVAKDTKITTPSIKVGNLYIPCFKGNIGEEVTYGDKIYTLSPLKVGDYRSVCSEKDAFDGRVYVNVRCSGVTGAMGGGWARTWDTRITSAWTAQSGFSVSLSSDCHQQTGVEWFTLGRTFWYDFSYTVRCNVTGEVVKTGHCSFSQYWDHGPMGIPQIIDRTVQISSAP